MRRYSRLASSRCSWAISHLFLASLTPAVLGVTLIRAIGCPLLTLSPAFTSISAMVPVACGLTIISSRASRCPIAVILSSMSLGSTLQRAYSTGSSCDWSHSHQKVQTTMAAAATQPNLWIFSFVFSFINILFVYSLLQR